MPSGNSSRATAQLSRRQGNNGSPAVGSPAASTAPSNFAAEPAKPAVARVPKASFCQNSAHERCVGSRPADKSCPCAPESKLDHAWALACAGVTSVVDVERHHKRHPAGGRDPVHRAARVSGSETTGTACAVMPAGAERRAGTQGYGLSAILAALGPDISLFAKFRDDSGRAIPALRTHA